MSLRSSASVARHTAKRTIGMKHLAHVLSVAGLLAGLVGLCAGCGPYPGPRVTQPRPQSVENLVYLDAALTWQIPCEALEAHKLPSGRTRVHARFVNRRNASAECQIKVNFKDGSGRVIDETGWLPLVLPRREVVQFEHTSLTTDVSDFTVMLRAAR